MSLKLDSFLHFPKEMIPHIRFKFNIRSQYENPLEVYKNNPELVNTNWLLWREEKRYYPYEGIIAVNLVRLKDDIWLLTTIKRITKLLDVQQEVGYEAEELQEYAPLYGRLIIRYHKTTRTGVMKYETICNSIEIHELLPDTFDGDDFPGYDNVRLTYDQLHRIVVNRKKEWVAALENQKAVYLITDTNTGKLYVGSATSEEGMLLARWRQYVTNGHGGNVKLIRLIEQKGVGYVKQYFTYSILENYNAKVEDDVIRKREIWWKETLKSMQFGYNDNL